MSNLVIGHVLCTTGASCPALPYLTLPYPTISSPTLPIAHTSIRAIHVWHGRLFFTLSSIGRRVGEQQRPRHEGAVHPAHGTCPRGQGSPAGFRVLTDLYTQSTTMTTHTLSSHFYLENAYGMHPPCLFWRRYCRGVIAEALLP